LYLASYLGALPGLLAAVASAPCLDNSNITSNPAITIGCCFTRSGWGRAWANTIVVPLRARLDQDDAEQAGGEFRIVPQPHKLEPPGTAAAVGTPGAVPAASSPSPPAAAAVPEVQS
jgi:hypothetical protein